MLPDFAQSLEGLQLCIEDVQRLILLFYEIVIVDPSAEQTVVLPVYGIFPWTVLLFQFFQNFDLFVELGIDVTQIGSLVNQGSCLKYPTGY